MAVKAKREVKDSYGKVSSKRYVVSLFAFLFLAMVISVYENVGELPLTGLAAGDNGPELTGLRSDPTLVFAGDNVILRGTGISSGQTVKLQCGFTSGVSDVCVSPNFVPADPNCAYIVPSNLGGGRHAIYCRIVDSATQISNERETEILVSDIIGCPPAPSPQCPANEIAEPIYSEGCIVGYTCRPSTVSVCGTITQNATITTDINITTSPCIIVDGSGEITINGQNHNMIGDRSAIAIEIRRTGNVKIRNLNIKNVQEGIISEATPDLSISVENSNINIVGDHAGASPRGAIRANGIGLLKVINSTLIATGQRKHGITSTASSVTIENSTINTSGTVSRGINLVGTSAFTIKSNNIFTDAETSDGIRVIAQSQPSRGNITRNNITTVNSSSEGIFLLYTESRVNENIITTKGTSSRGIDAYQSSLSANANRISAGDALNAAVAASSASYGLAIMNSGYSIYGNAISSASDGLHSVSSPDGNIITDNNFTVTTGNPIYIYNTSGSIFDNSILSSRSLSYTANYMPILLAESSYNRFIDTRILTDTNAASDDPVFVFSNSNYNYIDRILIGTVEADFEAMNVSVSLVQPPNPPAGYSHIAKAFSITANSTNSRAFLTVHYFDSDLQGLDERTLKIWRFSTGVWTDVGFFTAGQNYVDTTENKIYANISLFSIFAPLVQGISSCSTVTIPACSNGSLIPIVDGRGCTIAYECATCNSNSIRGDINNDGRVNDRDVTMASSIQSRNALPPSNLCCVDVFPHAGDRNITTDDVLTISRIYSGIYGSAGTCSNLLDPVEGAAGEWPSFKRNKERTSFNPASEPVVDTLLWRVGLNGSIRSSPVVSDGRVFIGNDDNKLYALDALTGRILWSYQTFGDVRSTAAVSNGLVYVGSNDSNVYALNATNGNRIWAFATGSAIDSSPIVSNNVLYIGSNDDKVYALNARTGSKIWEFSTMDDVVSSPAISRGILFIGSHDFSLYALNATNGSLIRRYDTASWIRSTPAVQNDRVYIGSNDNKLHAFATDGNRKLWEYDAQSLVSSPAIYQEGATDMIVAGSAYKISVLNGTTGEEVVSVPTTIQYPTAPALADKIYVAGGNKIIAYDVNEQGFEVWDYTIGDTSSSLAIAKGVLYAANLAGEVYAIGIPTPDLSAVCNANSARGDINEDGLIDQDDVALMSSVLDGDAALPANLCCIDINSITGDGLIRQDDFLVINGLASGSLVNAGTCQSPRDPTSNNCPVAESWSECTLGTSNSYSRTRVVYTGANCTATVETEGCCVAECPQEPSSWSVCSDGSQTRTAYTCSASTFTCTSNQERRTGCVSEDDARRAIEELRALIASGICGADSSTTVLAQSNLDSSENAFAIDDFGVAYTEAQEGSATLRSCAEPSAMDPFMLLLLIILLIILILLIIGFLLAGREDEPGRFTYYMFYPGFLLRRRRREEKPSYICSVCRQPTVMKQACTTCGRITCAVHTTFVNGKPYCPQHKPQGRQMMATRAVQRPAPVSAAIAKQEEKPSPPPTPKPARKKKNYYLLKRPSKK